MNQRRFIALALAVVLVGGVGLPMVARGQATPTVYDLATRVSRLETQVAVLSGATPVIQAVGSPIGATPVASGSVSPIPGVAGDAAGLAINRGNGRLDVLAGAPVRGDVPILLVNGTSDALYVPGVLGYARDAGGKLIATGNDSTVAPSVIAPGKFAVGDVYFSPDPLPRGLAFTFEPQATPLALANVYALSLHVDEATRSDREVVGIVSNTTGTAENGPISIVGLCFDQRGVIQGLYSAFAAKMDLQPGASSPFDARFYGTGPCSSFLIAAVGFKAI